MTDVNAFARELLGAWTSGQPIEQPPSARDSAFDLKTAYAVEAEVVRMRVAAGRTVAGRKVGYANKALWRALRLDTLAWAPMYDDTVRYAKHGRAVVALPARVLPKIEPEIIFKLKRPVLPSDAHAPLAAVEWLALGFEIIDVSITGKYLPADFVAALGFHVGLVVGDPLHVTSDNVGALTEQLSEFTLTLLKNDQVAAEGAGRNVLRSPALCLAELGAAVHREAAGRPLEAGEIISSGSLADAQPIAPGETWRTAVAGLPVADVAVEFVRVS